METITTEENNCVSTDIETVTLTIVKFDYRDCIHRFMDVMADIMSDNKVLERSQIHVMEALAEQDEAAIRESFLDGYAPLIIPDMKIIEDLVAEGSMFEVHFTMLDVPIMKFRGEYLKF